MSKKVWIPIVIFLLIVVVAILLVVLIPKKSNSSTALDSFAQCLSQKGATMYGTYYCSHCQDQKAMFGASFKYVNYVECTQAVNECITENVTSTPTWAYPNGGRYVGEQSLQDLANESGCTLPAGY